MAIRSPFHERSWPSEALSEATPVERARRESELGTPSGGALDLGLVRAAIREGLLMVFGPDGDPVPPQVLGAAAAEQPGAAVRLAGGPAVPAERIAAVLDAQKSGRLGSGGSGDPAWIGAMLGLGPQPETARDHELLAESCTVEVVAFGRELMITSPDGATFLLADARSRSPEAISLRVPGAGPIALGDLVARLLARADQDRTGASPSEFAAPDCKARLEGDALRIDLPEVGAVDLARADDDALAAPSVSLFMASGEVATIDDLVSALSRPAARTSTAGYVDPPDPAMPRSDADGPRPHSIPLAIGLPDALAEEPNRVAVVVVRGLPEGASLSAGSGSGDGSWLLSPRDLPGLSVTPPPHCASDLTLEAAAIAIMNPEGQLTGAAATVFVPLHPATAPAATPDPQPARMVEPAASAMVEAVPAPPDEPGHAPIPLGLDTQDLSVGGPFDAVIVRHLPEGVSLSAGTYDPAIAGWVLLPNQLSELSVITSGQSTEFALDLLGVCLRPGGGARARVLARVPVSTA